MSVDLADALRQGDWVHAQRLFDAACAESGLILLDDHEPSLFEGFYMARPEKPEPPLSRIVETARSWEQFDRAFAPVRDVLEGSQAQTRIARSVESARRFLRITAMPCATLDEHLVVTAGVVMSFDAEGWSRLVGADTHSGAVPRDFDADAPDALRAQGPEAAGADRDAAAHLANLFREHVRRGPRAEANRAR